MALDFPNTPIDGQVYDNFIYDASKGTWKSLSSGASPNYLVNPTITDAVITATADTPSTVPITVNGAASQTANLQEWKNSDGFSLLELSSAGRLTLRNPATNGQVFRLNNDTNNGVELGRIDGVASSTYIDFHSGSSVTDFDVRIRSVGGNGTNAGGTFEVQSSNLLLTGGRLSVPNQPSFRARVNISTSYAAGWNKIAATTEVHDNTNNYDAPNSRFTAPVAGIYFLSAAVSNNGAEGDGTLAISINGVREQYISVSNADSGTSYQGMSVAAAVSLAANDYVEPWRFFSSGVTTRVAAWSGYFSGHLLG
jgi:hypothetical protein